MDPGEDDALAAYRRAVPVPLPAPGEEKLTRPTAAETQFNARGVATASAPPSGLTELQRMLLESVFHAMTDHPVDLRGYAPVSAAEYAESLRWRTLGFRERMVQMTLLSALVLRPLPPEVTARIGEYADELGVTNDLIHVARGFAAGSLGLAAIDFERNGYTSAWHPDDAQALHTSRELQAAWDVDVADPALAARWQALESLPDGTLGQGVARLYQARGFAYPGMPGSAPPLLAQHDWVHVLAGYGTTVESELEVFGFIARANDDMRAFSLLAMVISLFETGYLRTGAGLFEASTGHLSTNRGVAVRLADAMRRGAMCTDTATGAGPEADSVDFLRLDWFELAPLPVDDVRARFSVTPKRDDAVAAGSVGPWETGGISPFQIEQGRAHAAAVGREYDSYGASPPR